MKKEKLRTPVQLVKDLMEKSEYGPLAQLFVMDAIHKLADSVSQSKPSQYPKNGLVHPEAWIGLAKEIQKKLKEPK